MSQRQDRKLQLKFGSEVEKIIELDLSVIVVDGFDVDDKRAVANQPVTFQPVLDETSQYYVLQDAPFGIQLLAGSREELDTDLYDDLDFLWRQYAAESDDELTEDALELKQPSLTIGLKPMDVSVHTKRTVKWPG